MKCKVCKKQFVKLRALQNVCGFECAAIFAKTQRERDEAKAKRDDARMTREKLKQHVTHAQLVKEAQAAFNQFIRYRDSKESCISCNAPIVPPASGLGGDCDAGHYLSRGAHSNLRFNEHNVNAQCKHCNRYLSGNYANYRKNLIVKIGPEAVEALENDTAPRKYSKPELIELAALYKQKAKLIYEALHSNKQ